MTPASIGRQIRARRVARDLTLRAFALLVGVAGPTVSGWESGKYKPSLQHLKKIAEVLECSLEDLIAEAAGDEPTVRDLVAPDTAG